MVFPYGRNDVCAPVSMGVYVITIKIVYIVTKSSSSSHQNHSTFVKEKRKREDEDDPYDDDEIRFLDSPGFFHLHGFLLHDSIAWR